MNSTEAYETYLNGNISDFKQWLKECSRADLVHITFLWLNDDKPMLKLKAYVQEMA